MTSRIVIGVDRGAPYAMRRDRATARGSRPSQPAVAPHAPSVTGASVFRVTLAALVPLAVAKVQEAVPVLSHIPLSKLLVPLMLVVLVVALPRWQVLNALRTPTSKCVIAIAILGVLSVPLSIWFSSSVAFVINVLTPLIALFVIVSVGVADRVTARVCILSLVVSVIAAACYILGGFRLDAEGRPYIGGLDPNDSAALFVSTIPFATLVASQRGKTRWIGLVAVPLLIAAVVKTGSRGGVIGLLVVALLLILRAGARKRWAYVVGIVIGAAVFALAADEARLTRFETILTPEADYNFTTREGRVQVWSRGIHYMLTHPFLGVGINNFSTAEGMLSGKRDEGFGIRYTAAHNSFVEIGAELGVFGLLTFVIALWSAGRDCRRIFRAAARDTSRPPSIADEEGRLAAAAYCALIGITVTGFFLSFAYHPIMYFILAVCAGVRAGSPYAPLGTTVPAPKQAPARRFGYDRAAARAGHAVQ